MQQRITPEQLAELTDEQKDKLREWWKPAKGDMTHGKNSELGIVLQELQVNKNHDLPLLSIGQMIELLHSKVNISIFYRFIGLEKLWSIMLDSKTWIDKPELCDALWQAVKETLEYMVNPK